MGRDGGYAALLSFALALLAGCGGGGGGGGPGAGAGAAGGGGPPPLPDVQAATTEDSPLAITVPAAVAVAASPAEGALSGVPPSFVYAPRPDFHGIDRFEVALAGGPRRAVVVTVAPVNDAPAAIGSSVSVLEGVPAAVTLAATDADGDPLSFAVVGAPAHGTLAGTLPRLTYTPAPGWSGPDSFAFRASDGILDSAPATVSIVVLAVNDPPVASGAALALDEDTAAAGTLAATDPDGDPLAFAVVQGPSLGTLVVADAATGAYTYTPLPDANGADAFSFRASDGALGSNVATVTVTIRPLNDAPRAAAGALSTPRNVTASGVLGAIDPEGDPLTFRIVRDGVLGTATLVDPATGAYSYAPLPERRGADSFTFRASDGRADSNEATVAVTVLGANRAPTAFDGAIALDEDGAATGTLPAADPDGDPLAFAIVGAPALGAVVVTNPATGAYVYTPRPDANGTDAFRFKAGDGALESGAATVTVTIRPVNDPPSAAADVTATAEGAAVAVDVLANDADPDGDALTLDRVDPGAGGAVALGPGGAVTYTPAPGFTGVGGFTYVVRDAQGAEATGSVTVRVGLGAGKFNYGEALQKALYFFEAQRSGSLPPGNRVEWRGHSGLDDGADAGKDLTGGWYDAGDHVKFGFPMAASATLLAWGIVEYRDAYERSGEIEAALGSLRWATDYFLKAHTAPEELWGQVGEGAVDHLFWGPAEVLPMQRRSFKIDAACPGSDLAAETAAALAAASIAFAPTSSAYASELLSHAVELYDFATSRRGRYSDCIGDAAAFYSSSGDDDELVWAALWLHRATGLPQYLAAAEARFASIDGRIGWTLSWDDKSYGCYVLLAKLAADPRYAAAAENWLDYWTAGYQGARVAYTPGGLAWLDGWGTLRYAANTAFAALVHSDVVADPAKRARYYDFAVRQIDYMLGDNPRGSSYVTGFGTNPPRAPHHRTSHGSWLDDIDTPAAQRHVLYGALVGGPDANDGYVDRRIDFRTNEVATDFNAAFTGALARLYRDFGGAPLRGFPPPEPREDELFVEARATSASGKTVQALLNNRSGWPARASDALSFRYFVDLSEVAAAGFSPGDVRVHLDYAEGATLGALAPWGAGGAIHSVEASFHGTLISPAGATLYRKEAQLRFEPPAGAPWDPANDPSYQGLATGPSALKTDRIPVYEGGLRVFGVEPP